MTGTAPPLTEEELDEIAEYVIVRADFHDTATNRVRVLLRAAKRAITLESELAQLRRSVVANAGLRSSRSLPRWAHVRDAVGVGSTSARQMCRDAGFEPEELVGPQVDDNP